MSEEPVRVCTRHDLVLEERGLSLVCPGPPRHRVKSWKVIDPKKGRAIYEASEDAMGAKEMNEKAAVAEKPEPKSQTLERAKFEDGAKQVLFVRITKEPKRWGGDPFRIRWQQIPAGGVVGKKGQVGGVAKTCADEASAREAFKVAVRSAIAQGWKQVPIGAGGHRKLDIKPIPAPKRRAA